MEYIYADQLKKEFLVYGNFYDLVFDSGWIISCRNVLEIYRHDYSINQGKGLFLDKPDAIFIMMNPGSSEPRQDGFIPPKLSQKNLSRELLKQRIVKAKPDTTQYQVMRLMKVKNWDHVRIINLSDIRDPKSSSFIKQVKNMNQPIHSIFCVERKEELHKAFALRDKTPVICAWGTNKGLMDLASLCLASIPGVKTYGIKSTEFLYYHPRPSLIKNQIIWLDSIIQCLGSGKGKSNAS